jgi:hypothetical protein
MFLFSEGDKPCFLTTTTTTTTTARKIHIWSSLFRGLEREEVSVYYFYGKESPVERGVLHYFIHNYLNLTAHRAISHDTVHNGVTTAVLEGVYTP